MSAMDLTCPQHQLVNQIKQPETCQWLCVHLARCAHGTVCVLLKVTCEGGAKP